MKSGRSEWTVRTETVAPPNTRSPSTNDVIRGLFPKVGVTVKKDHLFELLAHVKPETVTTILGDLKNPKYAGPLGVISIEGEAEALTRIH